MIINKLVSTDELYNRLTNFYKDYLYSRNFIDILHGGYITTYNYLLNILEQVSRGASLEDITAYRYVPFFMLNITTGLYNLESLKRTNFSFTTWDNLTLAQRIELLDSYGYYEALTFVGQSSNVTPIIKKVEIDRYVDDSISNKYLELTDYILNNNKLYFFGDLAKPITNITNDGKVVYLKNIYIDYNDSYNKWGIFTAIPKPPYLTDQEYLNAVKVLLKTIADGPKIDNITAALAAITNFSSDEITVIDKYCTDHPISASLKPFDFAISFPSELMQYQDRIEYTNLLLEIIRPKYTNYALYYGNTSDSNELTDNFTYDRKNRALIYGGPAWFAELLANVEYLPADSVGIQTPQCLPYFSDNDYLSDYLLDFYLIDGSLDKETLTMDITSSFADMGVIKGPAGNAALLFFSNNCYADAQEDTENDYLLDFVGTENIYMILTDSSDNVLQEGYV